MHVCICICICIHKHICEDTRLYLYMNVCIHTYKSRYIAKHTRVSCFGQESLWIRFVSVWLQLLHQLWRLCWGSCSIHSCHVSKYREYKLLQINMEVERGPGSDYYPLKCVPLYELICLFEGNARNYTAPRLQFLTTQDSCATLNSLSQTSLNS